MCVGEEVASATWKKTWMFSTPAGMRRSTVGLQCFNFHPADHKHVRSLYAFAITFLSTTIESDCAFIISTSLKTIRNPSHPPLSMGCSSVGAFISLSFLTPGILPGYLLLAPSPRQARSRNNRYESHTSPFPSALLNCSRDSFCAAFRLTSRRRRFFCQLVDHSACLLKASRADGILHLL